MILILVLSAVLLALLTAPALIQQTHWKVVREFYATRHVFRLLMRNLLTEELGVVAITYCSIFRQTGTSTPPTATEASQLPTQTALVFWADTDVEAVVIHNWGLWASFPAFLFPEVWMHKALGGVDCSFATNFTFGISNTNQVTITKNSVGPGSGGTYRVYMRKPGSMEL